jgi:hypothetical protein
MFALAGFAKMLCDIRPKLLIPFFSTTPEDPPRRKESYT